MQAASERTPLGTLLSVEELAEYLGVPAGTLANWRHLGRGPAFVRVGRLIRYRAEDIAGWIEDRITYADDESSDGGRSHRLRSGSRR